jgi:hypothetical protein
MRVRCLRQSEQNTGYASLLLGSSSAWAAPLWAAAGLPRRLLHRGCRASRPARARCIGCWPLLLWGWGPNFFLRNRLARAWLTTGCWPSLPAAPALLGFCNASRTFDRSFYA